MTAYAIAIEPRYSTNQTVCFVGGVGKILSYQPAYTTWTYAIEMEMGPEPSMGRIGAETRIVLDESDILAVLN